MHTTLFHIGGLAIHTYGVAIALGFISAILLGVRGARRQGVSVERLLDLAFWLLVSSMLGSRLLYILTEAKTYVRLCLGTEVPAARGMLQTLSDCSRPLWLWEGGLVFYGGLIGAVLTSIWFTRRHRMNFFQVADLLAPFIALGHALGRVGCFFAGCCYGKVTASTVGVAFPPQSMAYQEMLRDGLLQVSATATPPLYPTQLFESLIELGISLALLALSSRKRYHGQVVLTYLLLYSGARFVLELFRGDPDRHYLVTLSFPALSRLLGVPEQGWLFLSTSQAIGLLLIGTASVLLWRRKKRNANSREEIGGTLV